MWLNVTLIRRLGVHASFSKAFKIIFVWLAFADLYWIKLYMDGEALGCPGLEEGSGIFDFFKGRLCV